MSDYVCSADRHGTASAYSRAGCRCDTARRAHYLYAKTVRTENAAGRSRRVPTIGTTRRLRALYAAGWRIEDLQRRTNVSQGTLHELLSKPRPTSYSPVATAVQRVYIELRDLPGPSTWCRSRARTLGWLPPVWWDDEHIDDPSHDPRRLPVSGVDEVAVQRRIAGDRAVHLTPAERRVAILELTRRGETAKAIAARLDCASRTVTRVRTAAAALSDTERTIPSMPAAGRVNDRPAPPSKDVHDARPSEGQTYLRGRRHPQDARRTA